MCIRDREWADGPYGFLGRALVTQIWDLVLDEFPTSEIKIPLPPLISIDSVRYDDTAGDEQTVSSLDYYVDNSSEPGWIVPVTSWPSTIDAVNSVRIRFTAGYTPDTSVSPPDQAANIPFNIKAGLLLLIGNLFENREENVAGTIANKLPFGVDALLRPYRLQLGMA